MNIYIYIYIYTYICICQNPWKCKTLVLSIEATSERRCTPSAAIRNECASTKSFTTSRSVTPAPIVFSFTQFSLKMFLQRKINTIIVHN